IETLQQDLRYAVRTLLKNRGFTAVAGGSFGLGVGGNTAIFRLIGALLICSLPVHNPQEKGVLALPRVPRKGTPGTAFSYSMYEEIRDGNSSFSGVAASFDLQRNSVTIDGKEDDVALSWISGNFFSVLGVDAVLGRVFSAEEDRGFGNHPVAVIGYGYWRR